MSDEPLDAAHLSSRQRRSPEVMSDEPLDAADLSSRTVGRELLSAALLEDFHEAIDGQVEVAP